MLIEKSRSGVYQDTSENRRLHRVGQRYGEQKQSEEKKGSDSVRDVEIVTSKQGVKVFLNGKAGGDYYKAVAEAYKALKKSGKSKSVDAMLKESGSGSPSKDVPAKKYVEAIADGASHDEAVAFANDCYKELLAKIKNVQEKVYSEGISQSASDKMFAAVNKWFNAQKFEKEATSESETKKESTLADRMKAVDKRLDEAAAKKQAEEIDRGVRAAEEKRNLEEIKRTNEKVNAAMKEQSNIDKKSAETSEKLTSRVTFADVPHSKDVNLKKYLTDSRRKDVDRLMRAMDGMPKTAIKHAHDAAVTKFNDNFDSMKKSERASALYVIMKYKDLMNRISKKNL